MLVDTAADAVDLQEESEPRVNTKTAGARCCR
jgi:hypothetical protein